MVLDRRLRNLQTAGKIKNKKERLAELEEREVSWGEGEGLGVGSMRSGSSAEEDEEEGC